MALTTPDISLVIVTAFIMLAPAIMGYILGANRVIGSIGGLLLGLFFNFLGVIVVYFIPKVYGDSYQNFNTTSPADELQKYKELLDNGAITEAEYRVQKSKILNS